MNLRDERGFTIVQLLVGMLLLTVGVTALAETLVVASKLTGVSERQSVMSHIARNELERLQTIGYANLAMGGNPGTSASPTNPNYYVSTQSGSYYLQWDPQSSSKEQLAIDAALGQAPPTATTTNPANWASGNLSGQVFDYITFHTDGNCGGGCPASKNYKRIVVEVTQSSGAAPRQPLIIQTLVADPNAAPTGYVANGVQNPLFAAGTQCQSGGAPGPCQIGIDQGTANSFFLYDTPASQVYAGAPSVANTLHNTAGIAVGLLCNVVVTLGCPAPDRMGPTLPSGVLSTLLNYSTELGGPAGSASGGGGGGAQYQGGRLLTRGGTCATPPSSGVSASNAQAETWVTAPLAASTTLNGNGGMTLFMQSANGVSAAVTLCAAIWVYPASILNLITTPPVLVGAFAYAIASLPATPTPISFTFNLGAATVLAVNQRFGVEVWVAAASAANAAIQYDNPAFASQLQLNTS